MDMMLARGSCTLDYQVGIRSLKGGSDGKMATNSPDYVRRRRPHETPLAGVRATSRYALREAVGAGFQNRPLSSRASLRAQKETPAQGGRG
jgi:hypothetical protein